MERLSTAVRFQDKTLNTSSAQTPNLPNASKIVLERTFEKIIDCKDLHGNPSHMFVPMSNDDLEALYKIEGGPRREYSPFYISFKQDFKEAWNKSKTPEKKRATDDSDDEGLNVPEKEQRFCRLTKLSEEAVSSTDMTITTTYYDKKIKFKGNQLICWTKEMMEKVLITPDRAKKIAEAISTKEAIIKKPEDWLNYEGMFECWAKMEAKPSKPFFGILKVFYNADNANECTKIEFKRKGDDRNALTYCYLYDDAVIDFLTNTLGLSISPKNYGMSYEYIVLVIQLYKARFKTSDEFIAKRQLDVFEGSVRGDPALFDRFLAFFNAVLFGSETSRISISFVTGLIILELISKKQLTYSEAFETVEDKFLFAAYPMASPEAGAGNFIGHRALVESSEKEAETWELSSAIGMKSSRETPLWAQIQLKEAILLKYWSKDCDGEICWPNASEDIRQNGRAVEFARQFNQKIADLLMKYFFPNNENWPVVYSKDQLDHYFPGRNLSNRINRWKEPDNQKSTKTAFNALEWYVTTDKTLELEKVMHFHNDHSIS